MAAVTPVARGRAGLAARGVGVVTLTRRQYPPQPDTPGHPTDGSGGSDPDSLVALERAGLPTAELIARAQTHLDTLHRAHPHLRPVATSEPNRAPGSDAWDDLQDAPESRDGDAATVVGLSPELDQGQAAALWAEHVALVEHVARLEASVRDLAARLDRRARRPR